MRRTKSIKRGTATSPQSGPGAYPPARIPDWPAIYHPSLDSTNLEAKRRIANGETRKLLIIADSQTNGQCRHDRLWESPPGKGVWASFVQPVAAPFEALPQSTLTLAVAVRQGIENATGISLRVKWPNDLLGDGQKCCGLLAETIPGAKAGRPVPLVLGVGINCNHAVNDFPSHLQGLAASLSILAGGTVFDRATVLVSVARSITRWFGLWEKQGFEPVREAWLAHNCTVGKTLSLPDGYGYTRAVAEDIDATGALMAVAEDGVRLRIDSGEILFAQPGNCNSEPTRL